MRIAGAMMVLLRALRWCHDEADESLEGSRLTCVSECELHHSAEEEPLEALANDWLLRCP